MRLKGIRTLQGGLSAAFLLYGLLSTAFAELLPSASGRDGGRSAHIRGSAERSTNGEDISQTVRLIRSDRTGVEVEVITSSFDHSVEGVAGEEYDHIGLKGAALCQQEGAPQLPLRVVTLGIPPEVDVSVEVMVVETERISDYLIYPAPKRVISETETGEPYATSEFYRDENLYNKNAFYPARLVELTQTAFIRDQRVAQIEVFPFQFNPATGELLCHKRLLLRVHFFDGPQTSPEEPFDPGLPLAIESPFEPILKNTVLNYQSSKAWRQRRSTLSKVQSEENEIPYGDPNAYKIFLDEDGVYSMSYEYLQSQGVTVSSIDPMTVKMYNRGKQIPIHVSGARDGGFDPGDRIQFYGEIYHEDEHYYSPYTETNVYWLATGGSMGMRMVEQDGSLTEEDPDDLILPRSYKTTLHKERDLNFERLSQITDESIDRWLWSEINADSTHNYVFDLSAVDDDAECEIEIHLRGITFPPQRPNHHTKIWLNGNILEEAWWNDQSEYVYLRTDAPGSWLWEGSNLLRIGNLGDTEAGDVDKIRVNWFQIDYWRGYQAENNYLDFRSPEGGETGLHRFTLTGFDSDDIELFDLAGKKIVNFQVSQDSLFYTLKFQDQVVRPTRYVALSRSLMKLPDAISPNTASNLRAMTNGADYIIIVHSNFYQSVLPLADYRESQGYRVQVVRVEDIYDEFNDGVLSPEAIRDFLKYAYNNWSGSAPTYVLLVGDTSWGYDKPVTHQTYWLEPCYVPTLMAWTSAWGVSAADNRLVCLVGNDVLPDMAIGRLPVSTVAQTDVLVAKIIAYEANPEMGPWRKRIHLLAGEGLVFEQACVVLDSSYIPPGYEVPRIYTSSSSVHFGTSQDLLSQWDEGVALATFTGHGGGSVWFDANFFLLEHVPLLNNGARLPVVISLTCFVGYFDNPWYSSLGEVILRAEDKGAVAHFGSSGVAWASADNLLGQYLFDAIFEDGERSVGLITTQGKMGLRWQTQEMIDVFNLLGDPATKLGLPEHEISMSLAENSLPLGQTISFGGNVPGGLSGTVEVAFLDNDTTGWQVDTTEVYVTDEILSPRVPVALETLTVSGGQFSGQIIPPDTLPQLPYYEPAPGRKAVAAYFWNGQTDGIGWVPVFQDIPFVVDLWHEPETPTQWEDVWIQAQIELGADLDPDGPDTVQCYWGLRRDWLYNKLNMSPAGSQIFRTDSPISAQGGATVYYVLEVKYGGVAGSPSTDSTRSSLKYFQVARSTNIRVAKRDISLIVQNDQLKVGSWIHLIGVADMDSVPVRFYDGSPDSNVSIGSEQIIPTIQANDSAFVSVSWQGPGEPHDVYVWVDPEMTLPQAPTYDDKAHLYFSNLFLVTPSQGTTVRGSNASVTHTGGNITCRITAGSIGSGSLLLLDDETPNSSVYAQEYDPAALDQPGVSIAALRDSSRSLYMVALQDSAALLSPSASVEVAFRYHSGDSLTGLAAQENKLKICSFSEELNKWILSSGQTLLVDSSMVMSSFSHLGLFGLFIVEDQQPPSVRINVEGQSFANEDYISSNPIISASIEDANGVDIYNHPVEITLNGTPLSSDEFSCTHSPHTANLCLMTYAPDLIPDRYTFVLKAFDCFGNSAADSIAFNVTAGFQIPWVANHPNPFQSETIIAYVVASDLPADQVTIKIYTVRGRLVRQFQNRNVGPGYVEVAWDGRDEDGERVANGVYYCKLTVIDGEGKQHSPILNKMAKLE